MGSGCSGGDDAKHQYHTENSKNKLNPTEPLDNWREKLLADIGSDPLAVIRDFPRIRVYVQTDQQDHDFAPSPASADSAKHRATDPMHTSKYHNGSPRPVKNKRDRGPEATNHQLPYNPLTPNAEHRMKEKQKAHTNELHHNGRTMGEGRCHAASSVHQSRGTSTDVRMNNSEGLDPPQLDPEVASQSTRLHQAFDERCDRVLETVLQLSELCGERDTFGEQFLQAWRQRIEEDVADRLARAQQQPGEQKLEQIGASTADTHGMDVQRHQRGSIFAVSHGTPSSDVHHLLLHACVESNMITADNAVPSCASVRVHTPFVTSRSSQHTDATTARGTNDTDANGVSTESSRGSCSGGGAGNSETEGLPLRQNSNAGPSIVAETASSPVTLNANINNGGCNRLHNSIVCRGSRAPAATTYAVRSATFYLMQYMVQGVLFFPVQRLRHVLWTPWGSDMQDIDWTIYVYRKEVEGAVLIAKQMRRPINNGSSLAGQVVNGMLLAANGSINREPGRPASEEPASHGVQILDQPPQSSATLLRSSMFLQQQSKKEVIMIEHRQTGRHYVETKDLRTIPRYELEWACCIGIDPTLLTDVYYLCRPTSNRSSGHVSHMNGGKKLRHGGAADLGGDPTVDNTHTSHCKKTIHALDTTQTGIVDSAGGDDRNTNAADADKEERQPELILESPLSMPNASQNSGSFNSSNARSPMRQASLSGVNRTVQQAQLAEEVVVLATVKVTAARVEAPPRGMCGPSKQWVKRRDAIAFVLQEQYQLPLNEVASLRKKTVGGAALGAKDN